MKLDSEPQMPFKVNRQNRTLLSLVTTFIVVVACTSLVCAQGASENSGLYQSISTFNRNFSHRVSGGHTFLTLFQDTNVLQWNDTSGFPVDQNIESRLEKVWNFSTDRLNDQFIADSTALLEGNGLSQLAVLIDDDPDLSDGILIQPLVKVINGAVRISNISPYMDKSFAIESACFYLTLVTLSIPIKSRGKQILQKRIGLSEFAELVRTILNTARLAAIRFNAQHNELDQCF